MQAIYWLSASDTITSSFDPTHLDNLQAAYFTTPRKADCYISTTKLSFLDLNGGVHALSKPMKMGCLFSRSNC